jgi:hypothetical protein
MRNNMTKIVRGCSALVLADVLPLAGATMASADTNPIATGDEGNPAEAAITKVLQVPEGLDLPTGGITYNFQVTPASLDGSGADVSVMPTPGDAQGVVKIQVTSNDNTTSGSTTAAGYDVYKKESASLFSTNGAFNGKTWPRAGVYEYTLKELSSAAWTPVMDGTESDVLWYSKAEYKLTVYVKNGATDGDLYVAAIVALPVKDADGNALTGAAKVDPSPGEDGAVSALAFTNSYSKTTSPTLPKDAGDGYAASVTKMVAGDLADKTRYFDFSVTLTVPAVNQEALNAVYKAYVVNAANSGTPVVETTDANGTEKKQDGSSGIYYFEFKSGAAKTIWLKHNQTLAFVGLPYNSSLAVSEKGYSDYSAKAVTSTGGNLDADQPGTCDKESACEATLTGIGAATKGVVYTNTRDGGIIDAPTGLDLDDAAYWAMIVLAGAALIGFVALRVRKTKRAAA